MGTYICKESVICLKASTSDEIMLMEWKLLYFVSANKPCTKKLGQRLKQECITMLYSKKKMIPKYLFSVWHIF